MKVMILEGSRPNETGYHFTNIEGLINILNSNKMLATNEPLREVKKSRYKFTFPDGSTINVDCAYEDIKRFKNFMENPTDDVNLKRFRNKELLMYKNNVFYDKVKSCYEHSEESLKNIKIETYQRISYEDILGKKSWSYTRRPEGMSYRNMDSFGDNSVRISIDIDKLTEKGYKVVPFSWIRQSKSGRYNEYEERVFGKGKREEGTDNFNQLITEIAFNAEFFTKYPPVSDASLKEKRNLEKVKKLFNKIYPEIKKLLNETDKSKVSEKVLELGKNIKGFAKACVDLNDLMYYAPELKELHSKKDNTMILNAIAGKSLGWLYYAQTKVLEAGDIFLSLESLKSFIKQKNPKIKIKFFSYNKKVVDEATMKKDISNFKKTMNLAKYCDDFCEDYKKLYKPVLDFIGPYLFSLLKIH